MQRKGMTEQKSMQKTNLKSEKNFLRNQKIYIILQNHEMAGFHKIEA